jgi:glycosyltransferase involved in cell wall biosynthesis
VSGSASSIPRDGRAGAPFSLYWYSQTIGAGRGLEDALGALALLSDASRRVTLSIRGSIAAEYEGTLRAMIDRMALGDRVSFLPVAPADEMVALAAEHDVGLALEQPDTLNRALCVTNKLFTYLAAGVAVAATDTPGQRTILRACPDAGFLYAPGDVSSLAGGIRRLIDDDAALASARRAARVAAEERFSWEKEGPRLVAYLVGAPQGGPAPTALRRRVEGASAA